MTGQLRAYERLLFYAVFFAVQSPSGKYAALLFYSIFVILRAIRNWSRGEIFISVDHLLLLFLWLSLVVSMVKPSQSTGMEFYIQIFWLLVGGGFIASMFPLGRVRSKEVLDVLINTTTIMAIITLGSYYFRFQVPWVVNLPYAGSRLMGGVDGPNEFAAFNLFAFTYSLLMILWTKHGRVRYGLNALLTAGAIFLSYSRSGILGLVLTGMVVTLSFLAKRMSFRRLVAVVVIASLVFGYFVTYYLPSYTHVRRNATDRSVLFHAGVTVMLEKPLFGWGLEPFYNYASVRNATPHNGFLLIILAGGVLSFLIYLLFLAKVFERIANQRDVVKGALFIIFLFSEMTFNNLVRGRVSIIFWVLIVLTFSGDKVLPTDKSWLPVAAPRYFPHRHYRFYRKMDK